MIIELRGCRTPVCVAAGTIDHQWAFERPTIQELRRVQRVLGLDPHEWESALQAGADRVTSAALDAMVMLVQLLHIRIGVEAPFDEIDFDMGAIDFHLDPAASDDPAGKAPTSISRHPDGPDGSTCGGSPTEASTPKSFTTAPTCGGGSDSP